MPATITPAHVSAVLLRLGNRLEAPAIVGIHSAASWSGTGQVRAGTATFDVVGCRSELEIREQLLGREEETGNRPLVIITPLPETALAEDVLARLSRRRLHSIDHWETVRELFRARHIDQRLSHYGWVAAALAESAGTNPFPPAPGGVVTLESVQDALLQRRLDFATGRPDLGTLLIWTTGETNLRRLEEAPAPLREALPDWLESSAGSAARLILRCATAGFGDDALPIGLVLGVVGAPEAVTEVRLAQAAARLERFWGGGAIDAKDAAAWARAAEEAAIGERERHGRGAIGAWVQRAEAILDEIGAAAEAYRSRILPSGFDQRLGRLGEAVGAAPDASTAAEAAPGSARLRDVREHVLAEDFAERVDRAEMALRLERWLQLPSPAPVAALAGAMARYADEDAFVDWARAVLAGGDANPVLAQAYGRLLEATLRRREQGNQQFAGLLAEWLETGSTNESVRPIERVLASIVAPLARETPVLVLVLDGMGCAVFRELAADIARRGWTPLQPADSTRGAGMTTALASVPSVTEWSRASLLTGRRTQGAQGLEKAGFAAHPDLLAGSRPKRPPVLFHKAELGDLLGGNEGVAVRDALTATEQRIVGIVINAVDDFLLKSDQVRTRWTVDSIRHLEPILELAATAGRAVVLTSDHGHVLENGTQVRSGSGSGSDRWRTDDGLAGEGEIVLRGAGATTPAGTSLIAAWSEALRYGPKKNGYHGGAAPQEMVVPIGIFVAPGATVPGWDEAVLRYPEWWQAPHEALPGGAVAALPVPPRPSVRRPKKPTGAQQELFGGDESAMEAPVPNGHSWIDQLFASPTYGAQEAALSRGCPRRDEVRAVLEALDARGGKLSRVALSQRLGIPEIRLHSKVAVLRRLLNTDGYDVLGVDDGSGTIELNMALLRAQFEI